MAGARSGVDVMSIRTRAAGLPGGGLVRAAAMVLAALGSVAFGRVAAAQQSAGGPAPWVGDAGIVETVEQIMARSRAHGAPAAARALQPWRGADRSRLLNNPWSPAVSQWPPAGPSNPGFAPADPTDPFGGHDRGGPNNPQTLGTNFLAGTLATNVPGYIPPDTMGDVSPTQILVCLNGAIKVFGRTGVVGALNTDTDTFFNSVRNGQSVVDPRVRWDRLSQRWYVSMINVANNSNRVVLAVSNSATITNASSFTFFQFQQDLVAPAGNAGQFADYPSLGVDANAVYIGANIFTAGNGSFVGGTAWVIRKSALLTNSLVVTAFRAIQTGNGPGPYAARGVNNDDPGATEGYFIGSDGGTFGILSIRRVFNPGGVPSLSGNIQVSVPTTVNPVNVPAQGSSLPVSASDDRLYQAEIHRDRNTGVRTLWTAHAIQVNASGVASNSGGRDGARWYQLGNMTGSPTLLQSGTLFDSAASNPRYYIYPTCIMSGQGHMALGASFGGAATFMAAGTAGRLVTDPSGTIQAPTTIIAGSGPYTVDYGTGRNRWGDYSATAVDPADDMTFWTFQEYADATNDWAVRVTKLVAPPPATPASASPASLAQGATNVDVVITGTSASGSGFFDPAHPDFPNAISAAVNGAGVAVNSVTYTDATHVTLNITVGGAATTGARTVTVTNPDGQNATSGNILSITTGTPPNDACADAIFIGSGTVTGSTVGATNDGAFGACGSATGAPDVWYYTFVGGGCSGTLTVDLCGSGYDTVVSVLTGNCGGLTEIGCDDDSNCASNSLNSQLSVPATGGTIYFIRVSGFNGASGAFTMAVSFAVTPGPAPANDLCANATAITPGTYSGSTCNATPDATATSCPFTPSATPDVWYAYTPGCSGAVTVSTCGSNYDTVLGVYSGSCGSLAEVACNDDDCGVQSVVSFSGVAGTVYHIRVAGYNGAAGNYVLNLSNSASPANDACAAAVAISNGSTPFTTVCSSRDGNDSCRPTATAGDVWYTYTATCTGRLWVNTCGANYDSDITVYTGACGALTEIACNDDAPAGPCAGTLQSFVAPRVTAGATYTIRVSGFNAAVGSGTLHITCCRVDMNGDGAVNVADYLAFLSLYSAGNAAADVNGDGQINVADYLAFLSLYSSGC
jgi:hypothetical protein